MQQPNEFLIFLIIFNGLVTLVIAFGVFTVKSIYKKIALTDIEVKDNRTHWDEEHSKLIANNTAQFLQLIEKQGTVKVELIKEQNSVKEHLLTQQTRVKEELVSHYSVVERDLVKAIHELSLTLERHMAKD